MELQLTKTEVTSVINTTLSNSDKQLNSLHDHVDRIAGEAVEKTLTCNGNGAQLDNIFTITGAVEIISLYGECTEATNATTLSTAYFDLYDGTVALEITDNGGTNLSAITVGSMIYKDAVATSPLTLDSNAAGAFNDGGGEGYFTTMCPFRVTKKTGATTTIRFCFTGDADTDVDMKFTIRYVAKSTDGAVVAA